MIDVFSVCERSLVQLVILPQVKESAAAALAAKKVHALRSAFRISVRVEHGRIEIP
jgi:hypothetical protein